MHIHIEIRATNPPIRKPCLLVVDETSQDGSELIQEIVDLLGWPDRYLDHEPTRYIVRNQRTGKVLTANRIGMLDLLENDILQIGLDRPAYAPHAKHPLPAVVRDPAPVAMVRKIIVRDIPLRFSKIYELDARDLDRPIQDLIKAFIGRLGWPTTYSDDSPIQYAFWNERHHVLLNDAIPINRAGIHETDILIIGPKQS